MLVFAIAKEEIVFASQDMKARHASAPRALEAEAAAVTACV
jgi:hypothetical protein